MLRDGNRALTVQALAAVTAFLALTLGASAQQDKPEDLRTTAIAQIGEAIAIDSACSRLRVDLRVMSVISTRAGLDMDEVLEEAGKASATHMEEFAKAGEEAVCELGAVLYGPKGRNAMNFLVLE